MKMRHYIQRLLKKYGFLLKRRTLGELDEIDQFVGLLNTLDVDLILDVGANSGQFAQKLIEEGVKRQLLSVEPQASLQSALVHKAKRHTNWDIAPPVALGANEETGIINISNNSYSSSLLPMNKAHLDAAPDSRVINSQKVQIMTAKELIKKTYFDKQLNSIALKIDTQGYELNIITGCSDIMEHIVIIYTEMSLVQLYEGAPDFKELYLILAQFDFELVGLHPEFYDPEFPRQLQVNGIFVKKQRLNESLKWQNAH